MPVTFLLIFAIPVLWVFALLRPIWQLTWKEKRLPLWSLWNIEVAILLSLILLYFEPRSLIFSVVAFPAVPLISVPFLAFALRGFPILLLPGLIACVVVFAALRALWRFPPHLRRHAMLIAIPGGMIAGILTGEIISRRTMVSDAARIGAECVVRHGFLQSISVGLAEKPQTELHAFAIAKGVEYGWSYSESRFFPLPGYMAAQSYPLERKCRSQMKG